MKEKIFKLLNTYSGDDYLIGRELFLVHYREFIKEKGRWEVYPDTIVVSLDYIEEFLDCGEFSREQSIGRWNGICWDTKDLI